MTRSQINNEKGTMVTWWYFTVVENDGISYEGRAVLRSDGKVLVKRTRANGERFPDSYRVLVRLSQSHPETWPERARSALGKRGYSLSN